MAAKKPTVKQLAALEKGKWKKGQSGNPTGKKGPQFTPILRKLLDKKFKMDDPITGEETERQLKELLALQWVANCLQGKERSLEMMLNRVDGAIEKSIKLETTDSMQVNLIKEKIRENLKKKLDDDE